MTHHASSEDLEFQRTFEACETAPAAFDHAAHVRLAYIYLCTDSVEVAATKMQRSLRAFLAHWGAGESKYHETMTRAWIMAVDHFMARSQHCPSAAAFMAANPALLDGKIMLTHYSAEVLFSPEARQFFVRPDMQPIPPP